MLPAPWHDSHPTFLALSPGAFNRVCVAVLKSRVMFSWHCEHVSEPTNVAPGMLGGAMTARCTVAQEIAMAVRSATTRLAIRLLRWARIHRRSSLCRATSVFELIGFCSLYLITAERAFQAVSIPAGRSWQIFNRTQRRRFSAVARS